MLGNIDVRHVLLSRTLDGFIPFTPVPCSKGVPCYGMLSIALLNLHVARGPTPTACIETDIRHNYMKNCFALQKLFLSWQTKFMLLRKCDPTAIMKTSVPEKRQ